MNGVGDLAARTPASRDRYVDLLRALSILVVVVGHWVVVVVHWRNGVIWTSSAVTSTGWEWTATWVVQVMPLFFFVGGFSNLVSYRSVRRRGEPTRAWIRARLARLLRPSLVFLGVWAAIQIPLHLGKVGSVTMLFFRGVMPWGTTVPFGPLWFLAVYAVLILIAPAMLRLHDRFGVAVPVAMVGGSLVAYILRFVGGIPAAGWVNGFLVWLVPHQLGFFYADGRLTRLPRRAHTAMAISGLGALALLTTPWVFGGMGARWFPGIGHYPRSMVWSDVEPITNTSPPTLCLLAMGFWSIGVVLLLRARVTRWLHSERPWLVVVRVNAVSMTLFLWHMTAFLLGILLLWPLGFGRAGWNTLGFWVERTLWVGVSAGILVPLVAVFARFERSPMPASEAFPALARARPQRSKRRTSSPSHAHDGELR